MKVDGDDNNDGACSQQAHYAGNMLNDCDLVGGGGARGIAAPMKCIAAAGVFLMRDGSGDCMKTAASMNTMLSAFAAHGGSGRSAG